MTIGTASFADAQLDPEAHAAPEKTGDAPRTRDSANTQRLLLAAARRRFARDGYSSAKVRDIAADAGVNMSLINRYFTSKEGLFEACLVRAVEEFDTPVREDVSPETILDVVIRHVTGPPAGDSHLRLLLLLRSSGDERADEIRRSILRRFSERMAATAGWTPADGEHLVLRAQVAMSAALGIVLLRSSSGLEPLTSASAGELTEPLGDLLATMLESEDRT